MKIVIIGLGQVGKEVLHYFIHFGNAVDIVLIDLNKDKAQAELFDFEDTWSLGYPNFYKNITVGDWKDLKGADLIIINVSAPQETSIRSDLLLANDRLCKSLSQEINRFAPEALILITSNPNDNIVMSYLRYSGQNPQKVIGTGTLLDSMRLKNKIALLYRVSRESVGGMVLGEHGPSAMIPWSLITIGGIPLQEWDAKFQTSTDLQDEIFLHVIQRGISIFKVRKYTDHGIGASTVRIAMALLQNESMIFPVSTALEGYEGYSDIAASLPCILNRKGAHKVSVFQLKGKEKEALLKSFQAIQDVEKILK